MRNDIRYTAGPGVNMSENFDSHDWICDGSTNFKYYSESEVLKCSKCSILTLKSIPWRRGVFSYKYTDARSYLESRILLSCKEELVLSIHSL